jgi:hypothetical protein
MTSKTDWVHRPLDKITRITPNRRVACQILAWE